MSQNKRVFGQWTAVRGKLARDDAREAYVTGPAADGMIRPLASFWSFQEAVRYAKHRQKVEEENVIIKIGGPMGERVWLNLTVKTDQLEKLPEELQIKVEKAEKSNSEWSLFALNDVPLRIVSHLYVTKATFFGSHGGGTEFGMYAFFSEEGKYEEREIGYNGGYCTSVLSDVDIESAKKFALTYERMGREASLSFREK